MKLKFAVASLLAVASMSAFAGDQSLVLTADDATSYSASFSSRDAADVLSGGYDTLTFTGVADGGKYDVSVGITGQFLTWKTSDITLNGVTGIWSETAVGKNVRFIGLETSSTSPFVLTLAGSATNKSFYDGNFSVTSAVPEPTTYGMLLGGLGIMGFLARRKANKA